MRRVVVHGGDRELVALLDVFGEGVEEVEGGWAVYTDAEGERALRGRFDVVSEEFADGWQDEWRRFHVPAFVRSMWIGPPWAAPPPGVTPVVIDPGRAFGTGAHATTRLCIDFLHDLERGSLLDLGCGSGVLAIAAAKLGYARVVAVDVDPAAVEATERNAAANGVAVDARVGDALVDPLPRADVALANVVLRAVEAVAARLDVRSLVTSGYYESDHPQVVGYRHRERRTSDSWAADLYERV